jgi:HD-like signal output (HDOD) protein
MPFQLFAWPFAVVGGSVLAVGCAWALRPRRHTKAAPHTADAPADKAPPPEDAPAPSASAIQVDIPFEDASTTQIDRGLYELEFGSLAPHSTPDAEHMAVLKTASAAVATAITDRRYFPRRPMVIPQLLQAAKNPEGGLKELVDIIMQDPVLAGDVLKLANSAYYRTPGSSVETLGQAVTRLGTDGLRTVVSTSILQPVFRVPKGCFDQFSETIWDHALKSAMAAKVYARRARNCDSFTAHLLALLTAIGRIVLFRLTLDKYTQAPSLRPAPEVFIALLEEHADRTTLALANDWELGAATRTAIEEHIAKIPVNRMSPLAKALYYGRLCGTCALLFQHGTFAEPKTLALQKGLDEKDFDLMWQAVLPGSAED